MGSMAGCTCECPLDEAAAPGSHSDTKPEHDATQASPAPAGHHVSSSYNLTDMHVLREVDKSEKNQHMLLKLGFCSCPSISVQKEAAGKKYA